MKFEGLGLIVKLFGFWGLCFWFRSMLVFLFCFCKLPILVIKKVFKNHPNFLKKFNFKRILGFGVYVYGLSGCWVFLIFLLKNTNFNYQKSF
jgi:hypothetical protein